MNYRFSLLIVLVVVLVSCKGEPNADHTHVFEKNKEKTTTKMLVDSLTIRGFETFSYQDEKTGDTIVMQKYFLAFLRSNILEFHI